MRLVRYFENQTGKLYYSKNKCFEYYGIYKNNLLWREIYNNENSLYVTLFLPYKSIKNKKDVHRLNNWLQYCNNIQATKIDIDIVSPPIILLNDYFIFRKNSYCEINIYIHNISHKSLLLKFK